MLPRVTVLKIIVFQQSFISCGILICVWVTVIDYSQAFQYLLISLPDLNLSHSNDCILYCTYLFYERFLRKVSWKLFSVFIIIIFFFQEVLTFFFFQEVLTFFFFFFWIIFSHFCFNLVFMTLICKYLPMILIGRQALRAWIVKSLYDDNNYNNNNNNNNNKTMFMMY